MKMNDKVCNNINKSNIQLYNYTLINALQFPYISHTHNSVHLFTRFYITLDSHN